MSRRGYTEEERIAAEEDLLLRLSGFHKRVLGLDLDADEIMTIMANELQCDLTRCQELLKELAGSREFALYLADTKFGKRVAEEVL